MATSPPDESQPRRLPDPPRRTPQRQLGGSLRSHTVQAWTTIALTALGVVVAVYFGLRSTPPADSATDPEMRIAVTATPTPTTQGPDAVVAPTQEGSDTAGEDASPCVDVDSGASVGCGATSAGLVLALGSCDEGAALAAWGVDETLESLLVEVRPVGELCVAQPFTEAVAAGARAEDLVAVSTGTIAPALRECARSGGSPLVSCAEPHELEWVGPWRDDGVATARDTCQRAAKDYANNSFAGSSPLTVQWLIAERADGVQLFRCLLTVPGELLRGTVRDIGTDTLPLVP